MNFTQLQAFFRSAYDSAKKTITIDIHQFGLTELANFLFETTGSFTIDITGVNEENLVVENQQILLSGETSIWKGATKRVEIVIKNKAHDPSIQINFHVSPSELPTIFPVLDDRAFTELPFIEGQSAQLIFSSDEQSQGELTFRIHLPVDAASSTWTYFNPFLGTISNSELIGTLTKTEEEISFSMMLSPIREISLFNTKIEVSSSIELLDYSSFVSDEIDDDDEKFDEDIISEEDFDSLDEIDEFNEFPDTTGLIINIKINENLSFNAILSSLSPRLIHFETAQDLDLTDLASLNWLLGENDLRSFLPESIGGNIQLLVKKIRLAINVSKPAILSAELDVEISGNESIRLIPGHLELEKVALSFFINAPFKEKNFLATATADFELEKARFGISASFPSLNFSLNLIRDSKFTFENLTSLFPFSFPEIPNMAISHFSFSGGIKENSTIRLQAQLTDIWSLPIGNSSFDLEAIEFSYQRDNGFSSGRARGMMRIFDLPFFISVLHSQAQEGLFIEGGIPEGESIHITDLIEKIGELFEFPVPTQVPDITINELLIGFDTHTKNFRFRAGGELHEKLDPIDQGKVSVELNLTHDAEKNTHSFQLKLDGEIKIDHTELRFSADVGHPNWSLSANWVKGDGEALHLLDLVQLFNKDETFTHVDPEIKNALSLSQIGLSYHNETKLFQASLSTDGGESVVIAGGKPNGNWGFLFGIGYDQVNKVPLLGSHLENVSEKIHLENLWFIYNGFADQQTLPELPEPFAHIINSKSLTDQIMLMATLDLGKNDHNKGLSNLREPLKNSELTLYAGITFRGKEKGITLKAELSGDVEIPLSDENVLALEDCFIQFDYHNSLFEIILGGTMHFVIDHLPISPSLQLIVSNHGLEAEVDLKFGDDIHEGWHPFGIEGLTVDEIGLLLGVDFETSGIEFGLFGKFSITDQKHVSEAQKNNIDFGIVLEMIGDVPNPEYFALNIQEIDFTELAKLFIGTSKDGSNSITSTLKGENLSIYWAEKVLTLPDGTKTNPLFGLHGEFDIFGWKAYAHLDVHTDSGIRGDAQTDKIDWGIFQLSGNGKELIVYKDDQGNIVSNADIRNRSADRTITPFTIVHAGGPVIHFDSSTSPFLNASIHARLLSFIHAELDAEITNAGFLFNLHFEIEHITNFRLHCELKEGTDLTVNGNFFAGIQLAPIDTAFDPFPIELGVLANIHLHVNAAEPQKFQLSLHGGLDVMGVEIPFVAINVKDFPEDAKLIPLWLAATFTETIFPGLHELFQKAYNELKSQHKPFDAAKYAAALELLDFAESWKTFVEADIEELNRELHTSAQSARDLAQKITNQLGTTRNEGNSLNNTVKDKHVTETKRLDEQAKQVVNQSQTIRQKTFDRNAIWIANHRREIREIKDEQTLLRSTINSLWDEHIQEFSSAKTPSEFHLKLIEVSELVQQRVEALKLPIPDEHLAAFENGEHLHRTNAVDEEYNHLLNVEARYQLYPEISGKYTAQAVNHHATMIRTERVSNARELAIIWEAEQQATTIIERAREEMRAFSASN